MLASTTWLRRCALGLICLLSVTLFVATAGTAEASQRERRERKIDHAIAVARNQIGDPYRYGAAGPGAFDCSGLTMFAFGKAGLNLPRTSDAQAKDVRRIYRKNMHKGDLMFFYGSGGVYHMGIFVGWDNGRRIILHASRPGRPVQRDRVWTGKWFAGTLRVRR
jgi:cell wall-associated NlpC family hydrolase